MHQCHHWVFFSLFLFIRNTANLTSYLHINAMFDRSVHLCRGFLSNDEADFKERVWYGFLCVGSPSTKWTYKCFISGVKTFPSFFYDSHPCFPFFLIFLGTWPGNPVPSHFFHMIFDCQFIRLSLTIATAVYTTDFIATNIHFDVKNWTMTWFWPTVISMKHCIEINYGNYDVKFS